tara:strand:+ start:2373 stop:2756 length:384 start_codon:yes stop_codon:yes gene_type:complete
MKDNIFIKAEKKDGKLSYPIQASKTRYDNFINNIPDGSKIEIFVSISGKMGSNAQLAKVHVMIRELANDLGYTFEEVKLMAKRKSGLCYRKGNDEYCKSFADCDIDEMNLVIKSLIEIGDFTNINLR